MGSWARIGKESKGIDIALSLVEGCGEILMKICSPTGIEPTFPFVGETIVYKVCTQVLFLSESTSPLLRLLEYDGR